MTNEGDDPRKAEVEEFKRRMENGSITAKEMISKTLDIHKHKTAVSGLSPDMIESNVLAACNLKKVFLYVVYQTNSSKSKYFQSVINRIEDKYFDPIDNGKYADADIASVEIGHYTWVILKKSRVTKEQIAEELYQDRDEEFRKKMIEVIKGLDPETYREINGIPFYTSNIEDNQAMDDAAIALSKKHSAMFGPA
jgi:hypothetical protein